jgi:preprotein translocase SecE subunit
MKYLHNVRAEMKQVTWPSVDSAFRSSAVVIVLAVVIAYYLGVLDYLFEQIIRLIAQL